MICIFLNISPLVELEPIAITNFTLYYNHISKEITINVNILGVPYLVKEG